MTNFSLASSDLVTFPNSLDPDEDRQNAGLELDPHSLTVFLEHFFEKVNFEKKSTN